MKRLPSLLVLIFLILLARGATAASVVPGFTIKDVQGNNYTLSKAGHKSATAFVVLGTDCVISRRMIPELNKLAGFAEKNKISFFGVLADEWADVNDGKEFQRNYEISFPLLMDDELLLAAQLKPRVRPEVFVFNQADELVYRGRIDNRFEELGILRNVITKHELRDALIAVSKQQSPKNKDTIPIGCVYKPWPKNDNNKTEE